MCKNHQRRKIKTIKENLMLEKSYKFGKQIKNRGVSQIKNFPKTVLLLAEVEQSALTPQSSYNHEWQLESCRY